MHANIKSLPQRIFLYAAACTLAFTTLNYLSDSLIHRIPTISSMLFRADDFVDDFSYYDCLFYGNEISVR